MAKFKFNEYVRMREVIMSSYRGQIGKIVEVKPSSQGKDTLDKYHVRFPDGETIEVWSIQLEPV